MPKNYLHLFVPTKIINLFSSARMKQQSVGCERIGGDTTTIEI